MAKCPKCNSVLPFFKVGFLSKRNYKIRCKSCESIIETKSSKLSAYGAVGAGASTYFMFRHKSIFGDNDCSMIYGILCSATFLLLFLFFLNKVLKFTISDNQKESLTNDSIILSNNKKPKLPENPSRIEYLKNIYYNKTDIELDNISNDSIMTIEAQQAAKEILIERLNKSNPPQ